MKKGPKHDAISDFLPTEGWLGEYLKFATNLEACPRFKFFASVCILGAAVNNKIWLQRGGEGLLPPLMPNLWVTLLAPPYRGHKTSTINMAVNCLVEAFHDVRILSDKLTPEAIVHALACPVTPSEVVRIGPRDATGLIKAPEMSVLFGKQQYNTGMVSLITDLYDYREEWRSETIGRGKEVLKRNCISIIAGSTPKWLHSMIPQDAFTGGFMRRFVLVEMPITYNVRDADPATPKGMSWGALVETFEKLNALEGKMEWTPESKEHYKEYYESFKPTGDEQYDAYIEAECEQALKLAMALEINRHSLTLHTDSIQQAQDILRSILPETRSRIKSLTTHPRMHLIQEMTELFAHYKVLPESVLMNMVYRNLSQGERQFYEALSVMKKAGIIEPVKTDKGYSYQMKKKEKDDLEEKEE